MSNKSLDEIKAMTMKVLGTTDISQVDYITQELVDAKYEDEAEAAAAANTIYGHDMSYDGNYYRYARGSNPPTKGNACGENRKRLSWSGWDHESLRDKCPHGSTNHSLITKFVRR